MMEVNAQLGNIMVAVMFGTITSSPRHAKHSLEIQMKSEAVPSFSSSSFLFVKSLCNLPESGPKEKRVLYHV